MSCGLVGPVAVSGSYALAVVVTRTVAAGWTEGSAVCLGLRWFVRPARGVWGGWSVRWLVMTGTGVDLVVLGSSTCWSADS